jgi:5-(carboxyamino)imidazole ribonucleotide synthase
LIQNLECLLFGNVLNLDDGNGVKVIRAMEDLDHLPNVECITEEMISLKNELAVIVCVILQAETYPVVEMEFHPEANQVEYVICPARIEKISEKREL